MIQDRRTFIKTVSIASASALPVIDLLANTIPDNKKYLSSIYTAFNDPNELAIIDNNLLNLQVFFINTITRHKKIHPAAVNERSFMIVRLPQMHVSEKGFWKDDWSNGGKIPGGTLSGYSFLAFQLWPDLKSGEQNRYTPINFELSRLLEWNNKAVFKLITLIEWLDLKGVDQFDMIFRDYTATPAKAFQDNKVWNLNKTDVDNEFASDFYTKSSDEPLEDVYKKYKSIVRHFLDGNTGIKAKTSFIPCTFLNIADGFCLLPVSPVRNDINKIVSLQASFYENRFVNQEKVKEGYRKYEVWHNRLAFKFQDQSKSTDADQKFKLVAPHFRAAGVVTRGYVDIKKIKCEDFTAAERNTLPSLLDKLELTYLTQYAKNNGTGSAEMDFTQTDFDITESNGLFFTGLGLITHLKYYNLDKCPDGIDLIEYEHIITQGRDIFIKVARLGYNSKTGQRYKHVIEGKRKINSAFDNDQNKTVNQPYASFIELKQYCECIETKIVYIDDEVMKSEWGKKNFNLITTNVGASLLLPPVNQNIPDYKRNAFKALQTNEPKRIPIMCLQDTVQQQEVCSLENNVYWFWPVIEDKVKEGDPDNAIPLDSYLFCEFVANDWEDQNISAKTPFMFIRKTAFEQKPGNHNYIGEAFGNYFKSAPLPEGQIFIDRRKISFNNQQIAFTPSLGKDAADKLKAVTQKQEKSIALHDNATLTKLSDTKALLTKQLDDKNASRNKVNVLETEFAEYYFVTKNNFDILGVANTKHVVLPQILRAQVYVDHIRDLTHEKIASVVEYHEDYIESKFEDYKRTAEKFAGNASKSILKNTQAFVNGKEEEFNNTYSRISNALQQSKKYLGNLNIPDIIPDTISLDKLGITVPPDVKRAVKQGTAILSGAENALQKIEAFNPRELLRGKLSDVCGLDLTALLDEFLPLGDDNNNGQNHTPLFEINKLVNQISDEITKSPVYQEINADITAVKTLIDNLQKDYQNAATTLEQQRTALNADLKSLSDAIPSQEQLNVLIKDEFEQAKTKAFDLVLDNIPFEDTIAVLSDYKVKVTDFLTTETTLIKDEFLAKKDDIQNYYTKTYAQIKNDIPAELQPALITIINSLTNLYTPSVEDYCKKAEAIYKYCAPETLVTVADVYYKLKDGKFSYELTLDPAGNQPLKVAAITFTTDGVSVTGYNVGFLQFEKLRTYLTSFIVSNINGSPDQQKAAAKVQNHLKTNVDVSVVVGGVTVHLGDYLTTITQSVQNDPTGGVAALKKAINDWKITADNAINNAVNSPSVKDAIVKARNTVVKLQDYVDFIKNLDPYYYYQRYQTIVKQIKDTRSRFVQTFLDLTTQINAIVQSSLSIYKDSQKLIITAVQDVKDARAALAADPLNPVLNSALNTKLKALTDQKQLLLKTKNDFDLISKTAAVRIVDTYIDSLPGSSLIKKTFTGVYSETDGLISKIKGTTADYQKKLQNYTDYLKSEGGAAEQSINDALAKYIVKYADDIEKVNEARNLYKLLTSIKQQDLSYTWSTDKFRDVNLGIINFRKFNNPDTKLQINVRATTYFSPDKFPAVVDRVSTYAENHFTDFGLTVFDILTLNFNEISFIDGSDHPRQFNVKIKDVKFDGALSFVQAFESWLSSMGKGLILQLEADHVSLGYSLALPSIKTPGFNFFNLSLNFDLRLYFDNRPLRFGFSLARPDSKFGMAVGIYAGFGFFGIVADPKNGIVEIDCALEAGAWAGLSFGPFSGEVKLAFGFRYTKTETHVRIEGYIVAEGRLSVWVIEVAARIYLGIVSDNSYVEGVCTVTYSVKLGFISKSFSGSFHKKIAGASSNNQGENAQHLTKLAKEFYPIGFVADDVHNAAAMAMLNAAQKEEVTETECVDYENWQKFINVF